MSKAEEHVKAIADAGLAAAGGAVDQSPEAMVRAAAIGAAVEAVKRFAAAAISYGFRSPADRGLAAEWERGQVREIEQHAHELGQRVARVREVYGDTPETDNNITATLAAWSEARKKTADSKKARLLMAALMNAFDLDAYSDGLNATLLQIIASLDYGDLFFLKSIQPNGGGMDPAVAPRFDPAFVPPGSNAPMQLTGPAATTYARWHAERLINAGLAWISRHQDGSYNAFRVTRTQIGDRLIALISEEAFRDAELL